MRRPGSRSRFALTADPGAESPHPFRYSINLSSTLPLILSSGKRPCASLLPRRYSGQQLDTLIDIPHRVHCELPRCHGIDDIIAQHQVFDIGLRNQNALVAAESACQAAIEESFDLIVDAAYGLDLAVLVDRSGHRQGLAYRRLRQVRQQRVQFRRRSTVALDAAVGLLEYQAGGEQ